MFKNELDEEKYKHFLLLHVGSYIFLSDRANDDDWCSLAHKCFKTFVDKISALYGEEFLIYNVHSLLHVVEDVKIFGKLDNFSAFTFENHMQVMKRVLRGKNRPFEQAVNRLYELQAFEVSGSSVSQKQTKRFMPDVCWRNGFKISSSPRNNCCLLEDGKLVIVQNFVNQNIVVVQQFQVVRTLYSYPINSELLSVFVLKKVSKYFEWPIHKIVRKFYLIPYKNDTFVALPLL